MGVPAPSAVMSTSSVPGLGFKVNFAVAGMKYTWTALVLSSGVKMQAPLPLQEPPKR
jgi:hypothetical protein